MRPRSSTRRGFALIALVSAAWLGVGAQPGLGQEATPAAGTPIAAPTTAPPVVEPATTNVVTLAGWYANDPSGEFLTILPLSVAGDRVASADPNGDSIGRADLPLPETGLPRFTIGDSSFDGYLRFEGDVPERWTWLDDTEGFRPATLVIQVQGISGPYQGYFGTATLVSRDDLAGGVIVLALRPPEPAAVEGAAEEAVEEAPVEEAPVEEDPAA
ncbi:MAG: hypothetical protein M3464_05695 [Chloroflexota bacterium]|nr:hypothetical protein [Chloroflexota bacterium]